MIEMLVEHVPCVTMMISEGIRKYASRRTEDLSEIQFNTNNGRPDRHGIVKNLDYSWVINVTFCKVYDLFANQTRTIYREDAQY